MSNLSRRARSRTKTDAACLVDFFTALYTWEKLRKARWKDYLPQKSRACTCNVSSHLKVPEHFHFQRFTAYLVTVPGDRIARQDTWYDISCAVNSVRNCTAGVAGEVILELVQHIHGDCLLLVQTRWYVSLPIDHQTESVECCVAFENSSTTLSLCVVSQLSAGLHRRPLIQQVSLKGPFSVLITWIELALYSNTQGIISLLRFNWTSFVLCIFLYNIVCLCGDCGALRSSHTEQCRQTKPLELIWNS